MNLSLTNTKPVDFEEFGYQTMLACGDEGHARNICAFHLHAYAHELQPEMSSLQAKIWQTRHRSNALHAHLYDRPIPVSDAAMLSHRLKTRILLALSVLASIACFAGNTTTFYLFGFGLFWTVIFAAGMTGLPVVVGHLAYEKIVAANKGLQVAVILAAAALCFGGLIQLGLARRGMVDKAAATPAASPYVENPQADSPPDPDPAQSTETSESQIRQGFGKAMFWIMLAADLALGLLIGLLARMLTDEDYAAWRRLKRLHDRIAELERRVSELTASFEIAKQRCMAGILRAQVVLKKRRVPYHPALIVFLLFGALLGARAARAQTVDRYEGILIDTSGSISKGGTTDELFREYLVATKKLLLTEPANSRVWVSSISTDSFGGVREVLKGWTPDASGVFTDDLMHAQHELAKSFEARSAGMAPVASGTDIFGGLWRFKAVVESSPSSDASRAVPKTIWIFSDMMNETQDFPMPALLETGPEQMLERAKANGLLVPLKGYAVHVYGASPSGLTPQQWATVKAFWTAYFSSAGAELVSYSVQCDVQR